MGLLQIRNVEDEMRRVLKERAAKRGESLNTYVLRLLKVEVSRPTAEEVFERAARRVETFDGSTAEVVRAEREARDAELMRRIQR